jgi:hypothetical protein
MEFQGPRAGKLLDMAFFAAFLAYAVAGIDTRLVYHWQAPAFYMTAGFAAEFLKYPGGIIEYLWALTAQAYASQIWGALVLTAQVAALTALTGLWCRGWPLLRFVPAVLLVYPLSLYYDHTPVLLALLVGVGAGVLFQRRAAVWVFVALLPAVYYAGGMAVVFFGAMGVATLAARRRYGWAAGCLAMAAVLPLAVEKSRLTYLPGSARDWFVDADVRKAAVWWGLYGFCGVVGFWWGRPSACPKSNWRGVLGAAAVLACLGVVAFLSYRINDRDRRLAAVDFHTTHENWGEVLAASARLPASDFNSLTRYEINLALHETHRLGDEMFRYPQSGSTLPALRTDVFLPYMIRVTDLFLRLGRINDAEHFGNEAVILGPSDARVSRLMADLNLVKGQTEAARKFLTILSGEVSSAGWARRRLRELDSDPRLAGNEWVQLLRRRMLSSDDVLPVWQNPEKPEGDVNRLLLDQLERDPSNRMAFEFLMGNYLLARDLQGARNLMPHIRNMSGAAYQAPGGRRHTPRHYQEAMAMYGDGSGTAVSLEGLEIEPETLSRMAVFKRIMSQSPGKDAAMQAARERFHDSYFFFYVFGPGDYR